MRAPTPQEIRSRTATRMAIGMYLHYCHFIPIILNKCDTHNTNIEEGQVTPIVLMEMIGDPDPKKVQRVMEAMFQMKKIDIEKIEQAYHIQ